MDYFQVGKSNSLAIIYFFGQSYQKIEKIAQILKVLPKLWPKRAKIELKIRNNSIQLLLLNV